MESYYKVNLFSVVIRHDLYLYYTIDICTTQSISVLHNRYLYYTIDFCTTHSISVLHNRFLYYTRPGDVPGVHGVAVKAISQKKEPCQTATF